MNCSVSVQLIILTGQRSLFTSSNVWYFNDFVKQLQEKKKKQNKGNLKQIVVLRHLLTDFTLVYVFFLRYNLCTALKYIKYYIL